MKTILSIDPSGSPAGHSGIALVQYGDDTPATLLASWAVQGGLEPFRQWLSDHTTHSGKAWVHSTSAWDDLGEAYYIDTVIVEHFVNRNVPGADISPVGMEYVVRWLWPDAVLSPASGKNSKFPDCNMENLGFSKKDFAGDHHGDRWEALRHALVWLKSEGHIPTLRKAFPR